MRKQSRNGLRETDGKMTKVEGTKIFHKEDPEPKCESCGFDMIELTACHMRCPNCGFEKTCSDI